MTHPERRLGKSRISEQAPVSSARGKVGNCLSTLHARDREPSSAKLKTDQLEEGQSNPTC